MTKLLTSLGMVLSMFCMASTNAATISVSPLTQDVGPFGPDFTVGIVGNGFPQYAPGDLGYGGQIDISWDSSVITLGDPTDISLAGLPWSVPDTFIVSLNLSAGTLRVQVGAPGGMPVSNPSIATLNFTPVSVGTSDISLSSVVWIDALGTPLVGFVTDQSGQVNVIPVPAAVWLFVSGLLGIVGIARRRDPKRAIKYRDPGRKNPHSGLTMRDTDRFVIPRASITIVLCTAIAGYLAPGTASASYWDVTFTARQVWSVGLVDDGETIFQGDPDLFFAMQMQDASGVRSEQVFFEGSYASTTNWDFPDQTVSLHNVFTPNAGPPSVYFSFWLYDDDFPLGDPDLLGTHSFSTFSNETVNGTLNNNLRNIFPNPPVTYVGDGWANNYMLAYSVSFEPVPIPPALYLLGTGLIGLVGMARRKAA